MRVKNVYEHGMFGLNLGYHTSWAPHQSCLPERVMLARTFVAFGKCTDVATLIIKCLIRR